VIAPSDVRVATCVACGIPIVGDRMRCPACHAEHADALVETAFGYDDDETVPRPRSDGEQMPDNLSRWVGIAEAIGIVVFALLLVATRCS
jgi:hypothetical protein